MDAHDGVSGAALIGCVFNELLLYYYKYVEACEAFALCVEVWS